MIKEKSCGAVVYAYDGDRLLVLVEKMKGGHYSIPKGHVENDETEAQTALREIKEETGLDVALDTSFRSVISYSPYEGCIKDVVFFVARADSFETVNQECEVSGIIWATPDEALKLLTHDSDKDVMRSATEHIKNQSKQG